MTIRNPEDLARELPEKARILGLDVGDKTVGVAVSDLLRGIATPVETIKRTRFYKDVEKLKKLIAEREVSAIILGLPINMDGSEGPRCQSVRQFAANLAEHVDLPMAFWDERWSTMAVERMMIEADLSRKRRAELVDKMAAAYILQGALDSMKRSTLASRDTDGDSGPDDGNGY